MKSVADARRVRMGERLRALRHAQGLTLVEVAARSGLAVSTVSKVERGLMALTYDRFAQLADGLGVDVAELFSEEGSRFQPGQVAVARSGEFAEHVTENYVYEMLFADVWNKAMVPMLGTLQPSERMNFDRFVSHSGEEFVMVLEGRLTVTFEDRPPLVLEAGDSVYFDSNRGHLYASAGSEPARILVVCANVDAP
ncbi:helix-turn-helix domain-containing protein [Amorphus orientalis]|uniref:Transcriptional regulator with XRE-family HTH domain n=1 Tax=Amorphus orientalis TaxID=649198 RepID=A0AAE4AQX8_9HYPH|nr:XRE family transcriptional regulator [Amorphus orientalis]MDQ0313602.1 transcriptional regulator with XRE-family HTH domain [Amorphus orientalis]